MAATDVQLSQHAAAIRVLDRRLKGSQAQNANLENRLRALEARPRSITEAIDAIPGRRIESVFSGEIAFTAADLGQRSRPVVITISQDGPFIMTHYPMALWRPTAPDNTTNLNRWRPVSSFPLPTQVISTDVIDIGYEFADAGSQRFFQNNEMRGPILSRPDNIVPCAVPTEFQPDASIQFVPTYLAFLWNSNTPPTAGVLHVDLIGYRIVNM